MAAPSGNGSLLAGLGAFAVVVGGLAAYKHFKRDPKATRPTDESTIPIPDSEAMPSVPDAAEQDRVVTAGTFVDSHVERALGLLGKSEESVRAAFAQDNLRAYDADESIKDSPLRGAKLISSVILSDLYNYSADIGFFFNGSEAVTRVVIVTAGENENTAKAVIGALERTLGTGKLERKGGIGLAFIHGDTNVVARHYMLDNQWVLTAEQPTDGEVTGTLFGSETPSADCALVGKKPSHLGVGKRFVLGQPAHVVAATAKRIEPDMTPEFDDDSLALASGLPDVDITVTVQQQKLHTISYLLSEQRAAEITACWQAPALVRNEQTYWLVGNERYRLIGSVLDIERVERVSNVVAEVRAALGKRYRLVEHLENRSYVAGVPDTTLVVEFGSVGAIVEQDGPNVDNAELVVDFDNVSEYDALLKEFERIGGPTQLARTADGAPVLRATRQGAQFEIQPYSGHALSLYIGPITR